MLNLLRTLEREIFQHAVPFWEEDEDPELYPHSGLKQFCSLHHSPDGDLYKNYPRGMAIFTLALIIAMAFYLRIYA